MPVRAGQRVRLCEQMKTCARQMHGPAKQMRAETVRRERDRHKRQEWIVDERARVDRELVEAEEKREERGEQRVEAQKR